MYSSSLKTFALFNKNLKVPKKLRLIIYLIFALIFARFSAAILILTLGVNIWVL